MSKILIADQNFNNEELVNILKERGYSVIANNLHRRLNNEEVIKLGEDCVGIIAGGESYNNGELDKLKALQCISRCGAGLDNVDLVKAKERNIIVRNTPDAPVEAVAELTIGLMFALLRNIPQCDRNVRNEKWEKTIGGLLQEKTVSIVGLGRIGKIVAVMLINLGAVVIGVDINPDRDWCEHFGIPIAKLRDALMESDIITIHVSIPKSSHRIIGQFELDFMKEGSYLINTSRGNVIDEEALYNVLVEKHLAGAALDVFKKEPYKGKLAKLENVILTPHIGSYTKETRKIMEEQAVDNLLNGLKGR